MKVRLSKFAGVHFFLDALKYFKGEDSSHICVIIVASNVAVFYSGVFFHVGFQKLKLYLFGFTECI